jgi:HEPN domain-containing protein
MGKGERCMGSPKYVEESSDDLLLNAEKDMIVIKRLMRGSYYPPDLMYSNICYHATQAAEKQLKGFIIANGKKVVKTHNLKDLLHIAVSIDESFSKLEDEYRKLNQFTPAVRYEGSATITRADIVATTRSLSKISNFPLIKSMRSSIIKKYNITFSIQTDDKSPSSSLKETSKKPNSKRKDNDTHMEK